jgi:hypothetical protein
MKYLPYIILIIISIFIGYSLHGDKKFTNNIHDTIYINHTDTFISHYPVVVDSFIVDTLIDTLYTIDSIPVPVLVPIVQKQYLDSIISKKDTAIIKSYVSGYKPKLDSTIIIFKSYDEIIIPKKDNRWQIGIIAGYGASNNGFSPIIGVGISYKLFN